MANAINTASLAAELTAYIQGAGPDVLIKDALYAMDTVQHVTVMEVKGKTPIFKYAMGSNLIQPSDGSETWNATQPLTLTQRYLTPEFGKMDLELVPLALYPQYLARNRAAGRADQYQMTFEEYLIEDLTNQIRSKLEALTIWQGDRNFATKTALGIATGFLTLVADEIAATNITPYATGAITASNAYDKITAMQDQVPAELQGQPLKCFVNPTIYKWYCRDYQATFGPLPYNTQFDKVFLDGSQIELVPRPGMGSSQRIIITPQDNIFLGFELESDVERIRVEASKRVLNVMADFAIGCQFGRLDYVLVNDQA